jgi:hypothetical protein
MTQALSTTDKFNLAPVGPVVGDPHTPAAYCADLGQITEDCTFLFNRCVTPIYGEYFKFVAADVNTGTNSITITGHGLSLNTVLRYLHVGGTTPMAATGMLAPSIEGFSITPLYTIVTDANTIQVAGTSGGSALDITAAGDGDHYLFVVPDSLDAIMHKAFTHASGATIPAGALRITLAAYFASTLGATFTGACTFSNTVTCSGAVTFTGTVTINNNKFRRTGAGAYNVQRIASLNDAATQTYSGYGADMVYIANVSQNSTYTISDPPEAGIGPIRYSRRNVGSGFAAVLRRADASLMATFPDTGASWVDLWSHEEDGPLAWHVEGHGGNATNLD